MSDTGDANRGSERSEEARRAAQERGAKAHGPGGNPDEVEDDETVEPTEPTA
jgi:hypothetical protein